MKTFLIIFVLAMIASSCGFRKYVWFISLGYGAAVALIGAGLLISIFPGTNRGNDSGVRAVYCYTAAGCPDIWPTGI